MLGNRHCDKMLEDNNLKRKVLFQLTVSEISIHDLLAPWFPAMMRWNMMEGRLSWSRGHDGQEVERDRGREQE